ncbi:hypothetical protein SAMN02745126_04437 [Enhydrobacter aerosaccus]|uniref:DUF4175 domain-containing protein n=1 Tax=Enhydrobacter aerosaccus TaxID=225324 RepID=A0A1T4S932_9HYPH|nr:hypothetical protein [Enhydrobacter aerosaccus]SKA24744.1 hypothetical protein SAMN02745126_04437 [Enhydrobacter aerosaccus]
MIGLIGLVALLAFCTLLYFCAVYVVPFAVGVWVAFWAIHAGSGEIGGFAIGAVAGVALFLIGKLIFQNSRSPTVRWLIATAFAIPAAIAGFSLVQQIWPLITAPTTWEYVVGVMVGVATGVTVIARLDRFALGGQPRFSGELTGSRTQTAEPK